MILGISLGLTSQAHRQPPSLRSQLIGLVRTSGGSSAMHDYGSARIMSGVWRSRDVSGLGNDHTQAIASQQPGISIDRAVFDGVNDTVEQVIAGGSFTVIMSVTKVPESTAGTILGIVGATQLVTYGQGVTTSLGAGAIVSVDGAVVSTRAALYNALQPSGAHLLIARSVNTSGSTVLRFGRSSAGLAGSIRRLVVLDEAAQGAGLGAVGALAESWVMG